MDPFRFTVAVGPLALYLLVLGVMHLRRRPLLVSGSRDTAALGLAAAGLFVVGPLELFIPQAAADRFGPHVWSLLLMLYTLCVTLLVLVERPRLVVYNLTLAQLRPVLASLVTQLDPDARWAGNSLLLPTLGIDLHLDASRACGTVSLVAIDSTQSYRGWLRFEAALATALDEVEVRRSPLGPLLIATAGALLVSIVWQLGTNAAVAAESFREMLGQ